MVDRRFAGHRAVSAMTAPCRNDGATVIAYFARVLKVRIVTEKLSHGIEFRGFQTDTGTTDGDEAHQNSK